MRRVVHHLASPQRGFRYGTAGPRSERPYLIWIGPDRSRLVGYIGWGGILAIGAILTLIAFSSDEINVLWLLGVPGLGLVLGSVYGMWEVATGWEPRSDE